GNELQNQVTHNSINHLKSDVLEQDLVSYYTDRNRKTGKSSFGYRETVSRFTRLSSDRLYVQVAAVTYSREGVLQSRIMMYGTVNKGQSMNLPNSVLNVGNPFGF